MLMPNNRYLLRICVNEEMFTFEFNSMLFPLYADPTELCANLAGLVGSYLDYDDICIAILRASLRADDVLGMYANEGEKYDYVLAKAECELLNKLFVVALGRPNKVKLGDLSLDYTNNTALMARLNALKAKISLYEGSGSVATASKSARRESWVEPRW